MSKLVSKACEQFVDDVLLATHRGWKPREFEEDLRIRKAVEEFAARRSWRYRIRFWFWRRRLDFVAFKRGCRFLYTASTGADCWFDYFEGGYSPDDALNEDWSYA